MTLGIPNPTGRNWNISGIYSRTTLRRAFWAKPKIPRFAMPFGELSLPREES